MNDSFLACAEQLQAAQERIVVLETENATLEERLALKIIDGWVDEAKAKDMPRAAIIAFARLMERKLTQYEHKESWKGYDYTRLYSCMGIEMDELLAALTKRQKVLMVLEGALVEWSEGRYVSLETHSKAFWLRVLRMASYEVALEAADTSNYAMMIADNVDTLCEHDGRGRAIASDPALEVSPHQHEE